MLTDLTPIYGWLIKGLGGVVNVLEQMTKEGQAIDNHYLQMLCGYTDTLQRICNQQAKITERR